MDFLYNFHILNLKAKKQCARRVKKAVEAINFNRLRLQTHSGFLARLDRKDAKIKGAYLRQILSVYPRNDNLRHRALIKH